jgi:sterol desaturase/sphingolipid hydroxylase (fatty acid hydroxylase superfamily)
MWVFKVWLSIQGAFLFTQMCDFFFLSATKRNLQSLRQQGYSNLYIFACWSFDFVFVEALILLAAWLSRGGEVHFDFTLVWRLILVILLSDIPFFFVHRALHRNIAPWHHFHHCCSTPSFSTNFLFHPVDLLLEFGAPLAFSMTAFGTDLLGMKDPFALFLTPIIQQMLYLLDHDAFIKNCHYAHHRYISGNYWLYNEWDRSKDPHDQVRGLLGIGPLKQDKLE